MASLKEKWQTYNATIGLFVATLAWGASFFLIKGATAQIGVWPFMFWRFGIASLVMVVLFPMKVIKAKWHTIWRGFISGSLLFSTISLQTYGLQTTSAGKAGFITSLYVPLVPILGWVIYKLRRPKVSLKPKESPISYRHIVVAMISVFGLYILTDSSTGAGGFRGWWNDVNSGDIWTFACAVAAALQILYVERVTKLEPDSIALGLWQFIGCFFFIAVSGLVITAAAPGPFVQAQWNPLHWPQFTVISAVFNAIFSTCVGFVMQIVCQKYLGALKAALIFALEAPFATGFAFLFMNEVLSLKEFIGAAIVFLVSIIPNRWLKTQGGE